MADTAMDDEDLEELRKNVRRFVDRELLPLEASERVFGEIEPDELSRLQDKVKEMGLWLLDVPEDLGGPGLSMLARCVVYEEIGRSAVLPFRESELFGPQVGPMLVHATEEQRERFLQPLLRGELEVCYAQTEPDAGSDLKAIRTRAVREGEHFRLNGHKRFISRGHSSDYAQVVCRVSESESDENGQLSVLMVDLSSPGVTIARREDTMMGDRPSEILFDDARVPVDNLIGGLEVAQEWLLEGRVKRQAARSVGIAQRAFDLATAYASERVTFGRPLADRQGVGFMIADSAIELHTARLLVHDTAARFDRGEDVLNEGYMTKIYCIEMANKVVDRAMQIHGGLGLTTAMPFEYWFRQLRSLRITEGSTEVLRWRLGKQFASGRGTSDVHRMRGDKR